jgi:hypothetical protein
MSEDIKRLLEIIAKFIEITRIVDYRIELCERGLSATAV